MNDPTAIDNLQLEVEQLREALDAAMLELQLEDEEWRNLVRSSQHEFSKSGIDRIAVLSRLMWVKNPLIRRGVNVQGYYVFGQGVQIRARHPVIDPLVVQLIARNRDVLFGLQAQLRLDRALTCDGNLFLALPADRSTGALTIRTIPPEEITEVLCDPQDAATPWFYRRSWTPTDGRPQIVLYPDWRYRPTARPATYQTTPIVWDLPIYHLAVGEFHDWTFGLSEVYAAIDWGRAYTKFLSNWSSITESLARWTWKLTTRRSKRAVQAAATALNTTYVSGQGGETNPPPVVGSALVLGEGEQMEPLRTAGMTTGMDDARRLLLMVAAAQGLPETFYGDSSVGTLATAKSLDRPTELMMGARQQLWREVYDDLIGYQILTATQAPRGALRRSGLTRIERVSRTQEEILWINGTDGTPIDPQIEQVWPSIIEPDRSADVTAVTQAAPLVPDKALIARLVLDALRVPNAAELVQQMLDQFAQPAAAADQQPTEQESEDGRQDHQQNHGSRAASDGETGVRRPEADAGDDSDADR